MGKWGKELREHIDSTETRSDAGELQDIEEKEYDRVRNKISGRCTWRGSQIHVSY